MIERDPQRLEWMQERHPEVLTVIGDATLDVNLRESGILKARGLLSCLSADSDNAAGATRSGRPAKGIRPSLISAGLRAVQSAYRSGWPICSDRSRGLY